MSLVTMIADLSLELGISVPPQIIGAPDDQTKQLLALANAEGRDLCSRYGWQVLIKENTFLTGPSELQGSMAALVPAGDFNYIINDTLWNRSDNRFLTGSMDLQTWQRVQSTSVTGPTEQYHMRGDNLYIIPAPTAGSTIAFFYKSKFWCQSSTGPGQSAWKADDDTGLLDEFIMGMGIRWRFLRAKGLDYAQEFDTYERHVQVAKAQDTGKKRINLGRPVDFGPGINIQNGSYSY